MRPCINFSGRSHKYTKEEIDIVTEAMQNADPLTQGKYRDDFENKFKEYVGVDYAFSCCNATGALEMTAQLCCLKPGDEVIAPSHTFTSSVYPFVKRGVDIVWADIDLQTRVLTAENIEKKITSKTKAVIVAHLYGFVADMPEIMALAEKYGILVVEDAAQSLGTEIYGQKSGSFGDFGIFSFHSHKNITTLGEGGMLCVKNEKYAKIIPMIRHNGHCDFNFNRADYWKPAMGNLDIPVLNGINLMPGNYCLGEIECALGMKLLDRIDSINVEKRNRALYFIDSLSAFPELEFHRVDNRRHNYHLLAARVTNGKRDELIKFLFDIKHIQCVVQYYPLDRYSFYKKLGFGNSDCPNADEFFDNMISFPFHHWMDDDDFEYMLASTAEALEEIV